MKTIPQDLVLGDIVSAKEFLEYQLKAKESYSEIVQSKITIRTEEELEHSTCVSFNDGAGLMCVNENGDIESVLKRADADLPNFLSIAFTNAVALGGNRLDCYDCAGSTPGKKQSLADSYCRRGFIPVCEIRFNRLMVNPLMARTYGEPRILFFIYCGDPLPIYCEKLKDNSYPGLDEYYYIPTINEIQRSLDLPENDMDYELAYSFRNMVCGVWYAGMKVAFADDYPSFIGDSLMCAEDLQNLMAEQAMIEETVRMEYDTVHNPMTEEELNAALEEWSKYYEENKVEPDWKLHEYDSFIDFIKDNELPPIKHRFWFNRHRYNRLEAVFNTHQNAVEFEGKSIYVDYELNNIYPTLCIDSDGVIEQIYTFKDPDIIKTKGSYPIFSIWNDKIWFIDETKVDYASLYSIDINTKEKMIRTIPVVPDTLTILPIIIDDFSLVCFFQPREHIKLMDDLTAMKVVDGEILDSVRIGTILGANDEYIYCQYNGLKYRVGCKEFIMIGLDAIFHGAPCDEYIDASRDIVYTSSNLSGFSDNVFEEQLELDREAEGIYSSWYCPRHSVINYETRADMIAVNDKGEYLVHWKKPQIESDDDNVLIDFYDDFFCIAYKDGDSLDIHKYDKYGNEIR